VDSFIIIHQPQIATFSIPLFLPALHPFLHQLFNCASLELHKWIIKENGLWLHNNYSQLVKNWKISSWNIKKPEFSFARSPRERSIQRPHSMRTPAQCAGQSLENWTPTWGHLHTLMKTLQLKYNDDGRKLCRFTKNRDHTSLLLLLGVG